jgi:hypothetical protein
LERLKPRRLSARGYCGVKQGVACNFAVFVGLREGYNFIVRRVMLDGGSAMSLVGLEMEEKRSVDGHVIHVIEVPSLHEKNRVIQLEPRSRTSDMI